MKCPCSSDYGIWWIFYGSVVVALRFWLGFAPICAAVLLGFGVLGFREPPGCDVRVWGRCFGEDFGIGIRDL